MKGKKLSKLYCEITEQLWHLINKRWTPGGVWHTDAHTFSILQRVLHTLGHCKSSIQIAWELCWMQVGLKYALNQTLAYIPCWIRIKILCVGTASVLHIQELHQEWSEFVISSKNNQAYKAIKGHRQGEKKGQDFYLSLNHGRVQRKKHRKYLSFPRFFPHLAEWVHVCSSIQIGLSHLQKWIQHGNSCLSWGCK